MAKDGGCTNCVAVFNILLGIAITGFWVYCYYECYTGKLIQLNFAAGAWTGSLVIIAGVVTMIYSCVWNNYMGICAVSFNIFVIVCNLACISISLLDAYIEYRIYKDQSYLAKSINITYISEALTEGLAVEKINKHASDAEFTYDGAVIYILIALCCLLVTGLTWAWSCFFCYVEESDYDDEESEMDDEDEYTNQQRDNMSVRSPFSSHINNERHMTDNYYVGKRGPNLQSNRNRPTQRNHSPAERLNGGYYDDDIGTQHTRHVGGFQNSHHDLHHQSRMYDHNEPHIIPMNNRGWEFQEQYGINDNQGQQPYQQRGPMTKPKPKNRRYDGAQMPERDYDRHHRGIIPRAHGNYAESLPVQQENRHFGRNQYLQQDRAYSIDGNRYHEQQRMNGQSRRGDVNPDRSWMYSYY